MYGNLSMSLRVSLLSFFGAFCEGDVPENKPHTRMHALKNKSTANKKTCHAAMIRKISTISITPSFLAEFSIFLLKDFYDRQHTTTF